jgi:hypothetical protein
MEECQEDFNNGNTLLLVEIALLKEARYFKFPEEVVNSWRNRAVIKTGL